MTNETELMPCPFCGEDGAKDDDGLPLVYYSRCMKYRYCECDNCGSMTSECDTRDDAIAAWNTRAVPEGYALVPLEPTAKMRDAGIARQGDHYYSIYKAMIAAAQKGGV